MVLILMERVSYEPYTCTILSSTVLLIVSEATENEPTYVPYPYRVTVVANVPP